MDGDCCERPAPSVMTHHAPEAALQVVDAQHPWRAATEDFIARRYASAFGATLSQFMPTLFALTGAHGELLSAAGMRRAQDAPLFVEQYLDEPAEYSLATRFATVVPRTRVAEIGHLSGLGQGSGRRLFPLLARCLAGQGIDWLVFAATAALRGQFHRMGIDPQPLAPARLERLGAAGSQWGTYYDTDPWVVGGPVSLARHLIEGQL